ncbi:hypothetical protein Efla_003314 [Eimeria flavescens]
MRDPQEGPPDGRGASRSTHALLLQQQAAAAMKASSNRNLRLHLFLTAAVARVVLVFYGEWQDRNMTLKFTDIDYKVYTDAAEHVLRGGSPYDRHTYRYSPLVAYLCVPNLLLFPSFGKFVFCFVDLLIALLIEQGLRRMHSERLQQQQQQESLVAPAEAQQSSSTHRRTSGNKPSPTDTSSSSSSSSSSREAAKVEYPLHTFLLPCCCWLFHPVVATVSARGNADSLPCLLVLLTLAALRRQHVCLAAVLCGLSVHLKLYPVIYVIPILLSMQQGDLAEGLLSLPPFPGGLLQQLRWCLLTAPAAALLLPVRVCWFLLRRMGPRQWLFGWMSVAVFFFLGFLFYRLSPLVPPRPSPEWRLLAAGF